MGSTKSEYLSGQNLIWLIASLAYFFLVIFVLLSIRDLTKPPFEYTATLYPPDVEELCPGDHLTYAFERSITRPAALVLESEAWWSVDLEQVVPGASAIAFYPFVYAASGAIARSEEIPDIPAGRYEFVLMAQAIGGGRPSYHTVPIIVLDCGQGRIAPPQLMEGQPLE